MLLALAACGSSTSGGGGAATSTITSGTGGAFNCETSFPTFDKTCAADSDCVTKLHQINCCGTQVAIGVAKSQSAAFDAAEASCAWPMCGCATMPTKAEDGNTSETGGPIPVECDDGKCMTFIDQGGIPLDGVCGSSADGGQCAKGLACCYPCGIPDCSFVCTTPCDAGEPACVNGCLQVP